LLLAIAMSGIRLLITGGAGFIGSNLIRTVIEEERIERLVNLDSLTYAGHLANVADVSRHRKYSLELVDLRDKRRVAEVIQHHGITYVMHLAAESHVDRSIAGPADFIHTNIVGTFHLLEACRTAWQTDWNGKRFHHVSTDEVYGSLGADGYFVETTPYAPKSPYSASKAASDHLVRAYHHTYGLPAVVTNCSNNYGPYQFPEKFIPVVIQNAIVRKPIPVYGDGMHVRDWLYVSDHAQALWRVLVAGKTGETYNIGGRNEWTNLEIARLICDLVDELAQRRPRSSRELIAAVPDRLGHDRRYAIDCSKMEHELRWTPAFTFATGIRETIQWYLANQSWVAEVLSPRPLNSSTGTVAEGGHVNATTQHSDQADAAARGAGMP
jgi:dTDP-glucose 4,6-dehydratase